MRLRGRRPAMIGLGTALLLFAILLALLQILKA